MTDFQFHSPEVVTKQLAFNVVNGRRKVRLSSNFVALMGFSHGQPLTIEERPNLSGFEIVPAINSEESQHKVYQRSYPRGRSNNPLESVVEFGGQKFIDRCFPKYTERFHVEMRRNRLMFTPMINRAFSIAQKFRSTSPLNAFVALTGGVDIHSMESEGWRAEVVLESRPQEARDVSSGRNLSEVYALNTLRNGSPRILLNEDIHQVDIKRLTSILETGPAIGMAVYSLGCDDHSNAKSPAAKKKSIDDLTTMVDMVYPALKQIEAMGVAVVVVENVTNFATSAAGTLMEVALRRMGYNVCSEPKHAIDFGSHQARTRQYMVASVFPGFEFPVPKEKPNYTLWSIVEKHLADCKDVTDSSSIQARKTTTRNMPAYITRNSTTCPTILKSQDRGIKDAVYIEDGGRIYKPSIALIQELMTIPDSFDVTWMAKEQATETLGQSVDYRMQSSIMAAIREHLVLNCGKHTIVKHTLKVKRHVEN